MIDSRPSIPAWLSVLCALLLVWQPASSALVASAVVDRVQMRGLPLALLLLTRVTVAGFGIAAGIALLGRRPSSVTMARISVALTGAADALTFSTPWFPTNLPPGDAPLYVAGSLIYSAAWLVYLFRSTRVRRFEEALT